MRSTHGRFPLDGSIAQTRVKQLRNPNIESNFGSLSKVTGSPFGTSGLFLEAHRTAAWKGFSSSLQPPAVIDSDVARVPGATTDRFLAFSPARARELLSPALQITLADRRDTANLIVFTHRLQYNFIQFYTYQTDTLNSSLMLLGVELSELALYARATQYQTRREP